MDLEKPHPEHPEIVTSLPESMISSATKAARAGARGALRRANTRGNLSVKEVDRAVGGCWANHFAYVVLAEKLLSPFQKRDKKTHTHKTRNVASVV